jgi:hypothetical protein
VLPKQFMPEIPKECNEVLKMKMEKLPKGNTTDTKLSKLFAKDSTIRYKEQQISKVCATYAIQMHNIMQDK